ncbi:hypothetical protein K439DRAFT_411357 [Ramaria rubella]|nr:hypothetical protein K439DRAFT_411357 [Ramaria rubella]
MQARLEERIGIPMRDAIARCDCEISVGRPDFRFGSLDCPISICDFGMGVILDIGTIWDCACVACVGIYFILFYFIWGEGLGLWVGLGVGVGLDWWGRGGGLAPVGE